ncbi:MAG TPA: exo-beta-N-acetylmuramidase NamZ domain-containing protein, partial [Acidobacteriota bacterium]|nr:exo-beta-N-acetylmuramidase NamZ domain-containing protein [Acidobacteriota bacterium]
FRTPYVHGLTLGELARMAKDLPRMMYIPNVIDTPDKARQKGRLTVVPMRGWTRAMRWPDTGLRWVPTSPMVPTYEAVIGYAMVGLGTQDSGWTSGIGKEHPFRGIHFPKKTPDEIIRAMEAYKIPGVRFLKMNGLSRENKIVPGVYVEVVDWEKWRPTEVSFYMQKQAALWSRLNPYAGLTAAEARTFNIHVGSAAWYNAIRTQGGRVDVSLFMKNWSERAAVFQQQAKRYWLYQ